MARVLYQREEVKDMDGHKRVVAEERFFLVDEAKDAQTANGFVPKAELQAHSGIVKTNTGKELRMFDASFADKYGHLRRGPQTVIAKDSGMIIVTTGLGPDSTVIDAGAGSGWLAIAMARVCKHVTTYEIREDFLQTIKDNIALVGLSNITLKHGDITKGVSERDADVVTLDMPEPSQALDAVLPALKAGGWLVCYLPTIPQVMATVDALSAKGLVVIKTIELIERPWHVEGRKVRPSSEGIGHTAFLIFARKIQ